MNKSSQPTDPSTQYHGVDIAKHDFLAILEAPKPVKFPNTDEGCQAFLARLGTHAHIVCESTGVYSQRLVSHAHHAGVKISMVRPQRIHHYMRACGQLAKTDAVDARAITAYARAHKPAPLPKPDATRQALRELMRERELVVAHLAEHTNREERPRAHPLVQHTHDQRKALLKQQLVELNQAIKELAGDDADLSAKQKRLQQIKGIGPVSAQTMLAEMPELGRFEKGQAAAALGVAPYCRDSGKNTGKRHTMGGRPRVRRVLYMAAVSAVRANRILKAFARRLESRGKPWKVIITAVMRKLIELANLLLKNQNFSLAP